MICSKNDYYGLKPEDKPFIKVIFSNDQHAIVLNTIDWLECKKYANENFLFVKDFSVRLRSNFIDFNLEQADGVFFKTGSVAQLGAVFNSFNTFLIGKKQNEKLQIEKYRLPELIKYCDEERDINKDDEELIILNH